MTLGVAYDIVHAVAVFVFTGPENSDADYERYIEAVLQLDAKVADRDTPVSIQIVDPGNPPPSASWRKRIAEATRTLQSRPIHAIVTESALIRGVVTAMNWIRPPPFELGTFATFEEAVAWAEQKRGRSLSMLPGLVAEARLDAQARR